MFGLTEGMSYYVCQRYVNMGLGINGLYKLVSQEMGEPPLGGGVFIFFGKSRQSVKILRWDTDGFMLYHKRLERGTVELAEDLQRPFRLFLLLSLLDEKHLKACHLVCKRGDLS